MEGITFQSKNLDLYESKRWRARVDLVAKYAAIATLVAANLAVIGALYWYLNTHCPVKAQPILSSSLLVGMIGGLMTLNIRTFGVSSYNTGQYLNPVTLLGRGLAYLFFAPILILTENVDLTNYANRLTARKISQKLSEGTLRNVMPEWGPRLSNLHKYGFLNDAAYKRFDALYQRFLSPGMTLNYLESYEFDRENSQNDPEYQKFLAPEKELEGEWLVLREEIVRQLPRPPLAPEIPNFDSPCVRWLHYFTGKFKALTGF